MVRKFWLRQKSVERASSDFSNVRKNLRKALTTLSEGTKKKCQTTHFYYKLSNPFNDDNSRSIFWAPTHREVFNSTFICSKIIEDCLGKIKNPLDLQKFTIQVFPFETDDETERYKAVMQAVNDFVGSLNANTSAGLGENSTKSGVMKIFTNGSKKI